MRNSKLIKWIKKFLRFTLFSLLALIILANLFILLSGRTYLYKGIASTYLIGESGPSIYDLDKFPSRKVAKGNITTKWIKAPFINQQKTSSYFTDYNQEWETKAFLVIKDDTLLFEKYWDDHTSTTLSNSFSAAKTVIALLIGTAVEDGDIKSIDEPVGNYIPEFKNGDKAKITIRHLLLMASGLDWTESGKNPLSNNAESYYGTDLRDLVVNQGVERKPGRTFIYQSGNSQLLGFILQKATGKSISDYCSEKIWSRIGVEKNAYWSLDDTNGDEKAFCCLYATAKDFAKIGKLILQEGKWNNEQIVPAWYMKEMVTLPTNKTGDGFKNHQYGLHIWVYEGYKSPVYYCRGIKGQYIITIPDENVVIVRIGSRRAPNFEIKQNKTPGERELSKLGHPTDLQEYINFAEKIIEQSHN